MGGDGTPDRPSIIGKPIITFNNIPSFLLKHWKNIVYSVWESVSYSVIQSLGDGKARWRKPIELPDAELENIHS
jgi:hypothetical protein